MRDLHRPPRFPASAKTLPQPLGQRALAQPRGECVATVRSSHESHIRSLHWSRLLIVSGQSWPRFLKIQDLAGHQKLRFSQKKLATALRQHAIALPCGECAAHSEWRYVRSSREFFVANAN